MKSGDTQLTLKKAKLFIVDCYLIVTCFDQNFISTLEKSVKLHSDISTYSQYLCFFALNFLISFQYFLKLPKYQ